MLLFKPAVTALFFATLLVTFALRVHAEELQGNPVNIKGLVVSSGQTLTINDGVWDYVLLGVDNPEYEGKICEVFGVIRTSDGVPAINVRSITIIADEYPDEDLVGTNGGFGSPFSKLYCPSIQAKASVSSGVALVGKCNLSLPIWDGGGIRLFGVATDKNRAECRFHYTSKIRTA